MGPYLVNLRDHSIHHFSFEWAEHNGLVLDWIEYKTSTWLDHTCPNVVNSSDSNDKTIPGRRDTSRKYCRDAVLSFFIQTSITEK